MSGNNKFYWLKLKRDFFDRDDIKIIESMPNGKDYVLFYLKLLLKSIENNGNLRFSDAIPYDESMLSTITHTDIDVVRSAMKILTSSGLIEIMDDDTIFMSEVQSMMGSAANNDNANRQRKFRENKRKSACLLPSETESVTKSNASVTENVTKNNESKSIELDIEKDIEIEKDIDISPKVDISIEKETKAKKKRFTPPTLEEVREYCLERNNNVDPEQFFSYYQEGEWKDSKGNPVKNWKQKVITWEKNDYKPNRNNISKPTEQSKTYNPVTEWKRQNGFKENPWL